MPEIDAWQPAADNNNALPPDGMPESGTNVSEFNNWGRESMAVLARFYRDTNGSISSGGTNGAYTLTTNRGITALGQGQWFIFKANHTAASVPTLNVNGLGAAPLVNAEGVALLAGQIIQNRMYFVVHNGSEFQVLGQQGAHGDLGGGALHAAATPSVNGFMSAADKTKLDGLSQSGGPSAGEVKTLYESNADTNAFTDALLSKLSAIESGATGDQNAGEILSLLQSVDGSGSGLDADLLDGLNATGFIRQVSSLPVASTIDNYGPTAKVLVTTAAGTHQAVELQNAGTRVENATTSKTLAVSDGNTVQDYSGGSSITLTVNNGNHGIGTEIGISCSNTGTVLVASSNATIVSINSNRRVTAGGMAILIKVDTSRWILAGNLEA